MFGEPKLRSEDKSASGAPGANVAVAFLDIVGFSALMGVDERATLDRWEAMRDTLVLPQLSRHGGTFIKSTGDGVLATFPTADAAVGWASDVQRAARSQGEGLRIRIAMHFGTVIIDKSGDIYGDCVNIAARLEAEARPGGIIVSRALRDRLQDAAALDLSPAGKLKLKNIRQRVAAYHVEIDARQFSVPTPVGPQSSRLPSIAVLPFEAAGAEILFARGLVDDVIASLTGVQELCVISQSTVRALGTPRDLDAVQVGESLGVDYIVSGALMRTGDQLRTDVELIDAQTGEVLNVERSIFPVGDFFSAHDPLIERIVAVVAPEVKRATLERAMRKPPQNFTAYERLLQALDGMAGLRRNDFEAAHALLTEAIAADPKFASARAWRARWHTMRIGQGWSEDPHSDHMHAAAEAKAAIALDRRNALALATYGHVIAFTERDYDVAIHYLDRAAAAGPNNALVRALRSVTLSFLGDSAGALAEAEKALRLSPFDEQLFQFYSFLALAHYVAGNYEESVRWARRSLSENPHYTNTLKVLAIAHAGAGQLDLARLAAKQLVGKDPTFSPSQYLTGAAPFRESERVERLVEHFRLAGMPT